MLPTSFKESLNFNQINFSVVMTMFNHFKHFCRNLYNLKNEYAQIFTILRTTS